MYQANTVIAEGISAIYKFTDPRCFRVMSKVEYCQIFQRSCRNHRFADDQLFAFAEDTILVHDNDLESLTLNQVEDEIRQRNEAHRHPAESKNMERMAYHNFFIE